MLSSPIPVWASNRNRGARLSTGFREFGSSSRDHHFIRSDHVRDFFFPQAAAKRVDRVADVVLFEKAQRCRITLSERRRCDENSSTQARSCGLDPAPQPRRRALPLLSRPPARQKEMETNGSVSSRAANASVFS